jgi:polyhydroxyalkanoate synthesis regulator phasin
MFETLDKLMLAGLGAMSMTRERAEKIFDEYVQRGQVAKDARSGFVKDLMDSAERARADMEKLVAEQVRKTMINMDLPTREDIARLEAKIDACCTKPKA